MWVREVIRETNTFRNVFVCFAVVWVLRFFKESRIYGKGALTLERTSNCSWLGIDQGIYIHLKKKGYQQSVVIDILPFFFFEKLDADSSSCLDHSSATF